MFPLSDSHPTGRTPVWVILIIFANIFVFYQQLTTTNLDAFISQYALIPALVDFSRLETFFPFITSQFLHGGFLHIISNMWFSWIFGDNVEDRFGFLLFPVFYLVCGAAGGLAQYLMMPDSVIPMLGASGAIAGVLGAYFSLFSHHSIRTIIPVLGFPAIINVPASLMLFYWIFTQILAGGSTLGGSGDVGGVAYFAHIGGFIAGWVLAKAFFKPKQLAPV